MPAINPADLSQQSFAQLLNGTAQPQQNPLPSPDGGMSQIMNPAQDQQAPQAPAASQGPGILQQAGDFVKNNPMIGQALLHTFMSMAQGGGRNFGDTLGKGVASGAQAALMYQAQGKEDQQQAEKIAREEADKARTSGIDQQRADIYGRSVDAQAAQAAANTDATQTATTQSKDSYELKKQNLQVQLQAAQNKVAMAATEQERAKAELNLLRLQMQDKQLDIRFKPQKQAQELQAGNAAVAATEARTTGQTIENQMAGKKADVLANQPDEVIVNGSIKAKPAPTLDERWNNWITNARKNLMPDQEIDVQKELSAFRQAEAGLQQMKTTWDSARNSVKVGERYTGPDGKTYIRGK